MGRRIALAGAVVAVACLGLWLGSGLLPDEESRPRPAVAPGGADEPRVAATSPTGDPLGVSDEPAAPGLLAVSGQTLSFSADELRAGEPLVVSLRLPEPLSDDAPLPGRVLGEDGRVLELAGRVRQGDRRTASVEIDPAWLAPGRYIVELETSEHSHFPVRRFVLEVH